MIIFIVESVPENYTNVRVILEKLNIDKLDFYTMSSDLKLINILLGLQSHSATHGCTWCTTITNNRNPNAWCPGQPRTLGQISDMAKAFQENGSRNARDYFNCVNEPLLEGPPDMEVIDLVNIPELHLMLGYVNLVFDELNERSKALLSQGLIDKSAYRWGHQKGILL